MEEKGYKEVKESVNKLLRELFEFGYGELNVSVNIEKNAHRRRIRVKSSREYMFVVNQDDAEDSQ